MTVVTDQFAPPVSESTYGYVTCRVIRRVGDTDEASDDDKPDVLPGVGSVRFTPVQPVVTSSDYSAYVVRETIDAPLDALGHMVRRPPTDGETLVPGLWLVVGVYDVAFQLMKGSIRGFRIEVTAAHTKAAPLDLVTVAPYEPPPGATVTTMLVPTTVPDGSVLIKQGSEFAGVPQEQFRGASMTGLDAMTGEITFSDGSTAQATGEWPLQGAPGPANTLSIGTVTTGAAGSSASASITGSAPVQTLNLVLPRGNVGAPGAVATASDYLLVGTGRPDQPTTTGGIITGSEPVGCEYRSTDGAGVGAWVWRKRPTGWVVTDGDTGWRRFDELFSSHPDWDPTLLFGQTSKIQIRREGSTVILAVDRAVFTSTGTKKAIPLPAGFKAGGRAWLTVGPIVVDDPGTAIIGKLQLWSDRGHTPEIEWKCIKASTPGSTSFTFNTDDPWPTTLPGSPT